MHIFFTRIAIIIAFVTLTSGQNLQLAENEPFSSNNLLDYYESSEGEICDPSKQNPCKSPTAKCLWNRENQLYKCSYIFAKNERNLFKRGRVRVKRSTDSVSTESTMMSDTFNSSDSLSRMDIQRRSGKVRNGKNLQRLEIVKARKAWANQRQQEEAAARAGGGIINATREVPEYYGTLIWDGKTDLSDECIPNDEIAQNLQEPKSWETKKDWIEKYSDSICNFKRFFHCTKDLPDTELEIHEEEDYEVDPNQLPYVCRCFESTMPVVNGRCYIPANFGVKSTCSDDVIIPYPVKPWKDAPRLRPRCTPNSDCKESQYWFGKRCTCRFNAKYNSHTHACDKGTKETLSLVVLLASLFIPLVFSTTAH